MKRRLAPDLRYFGSAKSSGGLSPKRNTHPDGGRVFWFWGTEVEELDIPDHVTPEGNQEERTWFCVLRDIYFDVLCRPSVAGHHIYLRFVLPSSAGNSLVGKDSLNARLRLLSCFQWTAAYTDDVIRVADAGQYETEAYVEVTFRIVSVSKNVWSQEDDDHDYKETKRVFWRAENFYRNAPQGMFSDLGNPRNMFSDAGVYDSWRNFLEVELNKPTSRPHWDDD